MSGYAGTASAASSAAISPPPARPQRRGQRGPHRLGAARAQRGERRRVAARGAGARGSTRSRRASRRAASASAPRCPQPPAQRGAQPRRGRLEAQQRAHRVEQDRLRYVSPPMTARDARGGAAATTTSDWIGAADRDPRSRSLDRRSRSTASSPARARARAGGRCAATVSPETDTRLRFLRRLLYAVIILIGLAIALSQFDGVNEIAASPAGLRRDRRRDPRLRRAPDARQLRRRHDARDHAAAAGRRLGVRRGPLRRRRGRPPELHVSCARWGPARRDPERAARQRDPAQRHARRGARRRSRSSVWLPPGADAGHAVALAAGGDRARRRPSPRPCRRASASRSAASAARRPSAPPREAALRARCLDAAARGRSAPRRG